MRIGTGVTASTPSSTPATRTRPAEGAGAAGAGHGGAGGDASPLWGSAAKRRGTDPHVRTGADPAAIPGMDTGATVPHLPPRSSAPADRTPPRRGSRCR